MVNKIITLLKKLFLAISAGLAIGLAEDYRRESGTTNENGSRPGGPKKAERQPGCGCDHATDSKSSDGDGGASTDIVANSASML